MTAEHWNLLAGFCSGIVLGVLLIALVRVLA